MEMPRKNPTIQDVIFNLPHQLKIKRLTSEQKWLWVVILILAYESPISGKLYIDRNLPVSEDDLAWKSSIPIETIQTHLEALENLNMLRREKDALVIVNANMELTTREKSSHNINSEENNVERHPSQITLLEELEESDIAKQMGYTPEQWEKMKNINK